MSEEKSLKDMLYGCETFAELEQKVRSETVVRQENCHIHGMTKHSYCKFSGLSICIECVKSRRFIRDVK